ncbi:Transcriptional activator somA [Penicillium malachiteum]|nr:Transcriptional activator somA [Penicillium malachiteum]
MNQMNVGMNPGMPGPVGGVPMMNNGSSAPRNDGSMNNPEHMINQLNTYIYDYFLKRGYHDCARALIQDENIKLNTDPGTKTSPGNRRDGDMNGIDGDAMMTDGKDGEKIKIPDDLPRPSLPSESLQSSFLLDWFSLFWDFFFTQRKQGNKHEVRQYLQHTQQFMRMREQQNQLMRPQQMMPGHMGQMMRGPRNGMVPPNNLTKTVLQNNTSGLTQQQMAQLQQKQQLQMMQQLQREQSEIDMNGNRPQSPASADNAPSPSKRPRLADGAVNGQPLAPGGRGQGQAMQGQNPQMVLQNGMAQGRINPAQFQQFPSGPVAAQQKSMQVYAQNLALHHSRSALNSQAIPNGGMMNPGVMSNQADLVAMPDAQGMYPMGEYYGAPNGQMAPVRPGMAGAPNGQHGNHALQDYQMQLMLLEQQNKRRLMMARQEQDTMGRDGSQMPGQGLPPGTSPGSRTGTSPNPTDQMKRGTPKMPQTGLPGSPSAADLGQNRGSPGSMNLNGQMPPEMAAQFFPGAPNMRPPSSNPSSFSGPSMGQPLPANANRVASGQWQPGQMPPQHSPATQPQAGTPQDQRNMPPPQAPPGAAGNAGRAQESPAGGNAPPTPQPPSKAAPKREKKKNAPKQSKKNAAANQATGATPSTEAADPPQTPNPSTPVTPHPPNNTLRGPNAAAGAPPQQTAAPAPPPPMVQAPDQSQQFTTDMGISDSATFNLDFSALDNPDILESFDFDTFLNTDADTTGFGFDPNMPYPTDGVETGAGDGL